jgi:hypothetical protein
MTAEVLLSRLDGVKRIGVDRWEAKCPAHDDKRPSLRVREIDGDLVLVHCFAGCAVPDIVAAVGLSESDLFPRRPTHRGKPEKRPWPAADVLRAVAQEATVVAVAASTIGNGGVLSHEDRQRTQLAASRLVAAVVESGHE